MWTCLITFLCKNSWKQCFALARHRHISSPSLQSHTITGEDRPTEEDEAANNDEKEDNDDPEELARQRNFDEYKDEHKRGEGNRHNRGWHISFFQNPDFQHAR